MLWVRLYTLLILMALLHEVPARMIGAYARPLLSFDRQHLLLCVAELISLLLWQIHVLPGSSTRGMFRWDGLWGNRHSCCNLVCYFSRAFGVYM